MLICGRAMVNSCSPVRRECYEIGLALEESTLRLMDGAALLHPCAIFVNVRRPGRWKVLHIIEGRQCFIYL